MKSKHIETEVSYKPSHFFVNQKIDDGLDYRDNQKESEPEPTGNDSTDEDFKVLRKWTEAL